MFFCMVNWMKKSPRLDGFSGHLMDGNVKAAIKRRFTIVAQVTSNALALVNHFASRHRAKNS